MKRAFLILTAVILAVSLFAGCSGKKEYSTSEPVTDMDIKPNDQKEVESTIDNYSPDSGYSYNISSNSEDVGANIYELIPETSSTVLGNVYISFGNENLVEIDIYTKDCTDSDLKSAINMAINAVEGTYSGFDADDYPEFPLNYDCVKAMINDNVQQSNCIYSNDLNKSISFEFYPDDGLLTFLVTY